MTEDKNVKNQNYFLFKKKLSLNRFNTLKVVVNGMLLLDTVRAADNHESSWTDDVAEVVVDVVVVGEAGNIRKTVSTSERSRD